MRILLMADIHIGAIKDIKYFYNTITDIIEKEVMFKKTDLVVILGDYFDKLFKTNEDYTSLAINIMSYLVRACQKNKTRIRIVYGTESHEMNQYRLFNYHLTSEDVDMKIFETVTEETINGKKILYLPEEYINTKQKHYAKTLYSEKKYDFIFGHGVIEEGMPAASNIAAEKNANNEKRVPRFKAGELSAASSICVFGHYHTFTNMHDVFYLGSLFRSVFGEEEPKGYAILSDDNQEEGIQYQSSDGKYTLSFIENKAAYTYITFNFDQTSDIYKSEEKLIKTINKIKEENKELFENKNGGKIRLKFQTPPNLDQKFKETLKSILFDEKFITTTIKDTDTELISEIEEDIDDEYDYIIDAKMLIQDKIHVSMNKMYGYEMPMSKLNKYLERSLIQLSARKIEE